MQVLNIGPLSGAVDHYLVYQYNHFVQKVLVSPSTGSSDDIPAWEACVHYPNEVGAHGALRGLYIHSGG